MNLFSTILFIVITQWFFGRADTSKEGFVLTENIGMRIKAMEYWRCAEVGLTAPSATEEDSSLKIVLAEPLIGYGKFSASCFLHHLEQ